MGHFDLDTIESADWGIEVQYNMTEKIAYLLNGIILGRFTEFNLCAHSL